jgi:hypothetical protein
LTVSVTNQADVGSELSVTAPPAPSTAQSGARSATSATAAARRSGMPATCGLAFVIMIEAAWVGVLLFLVLTLIFG